jgi:NAD(P)-dependent dehydrogenase (short-subunit alcohol dehydrogenase family)
MRGRECEPTIEAGKQAIPTGRPGTPEEIASVVAFVASDEASFLCGAAIVVNGGRTVV